MMMSFACGPLTSQQGNDLAGARYLPELDQQYAEVTDLDDSFDPFGLSLTLGRAADLKARPNWEVNFDFPRQRFVMKAKPHAIQTAQEQVERLFPDLDFAEDGREVIDDRVEMIGAVRQRPRGDDRS